MEKKLSVAQLNKYLNGVIEDELVLQNIMVYGEIFEFNISGNNSYLTLKEDDYILSCVWFGNTNKVEKGTMVTLTGSVKFFTKQGRLNFIISSLEKTGKGKINEDYEKLKQTLQKEGIFDNKLSLPSFINNVVVITSQTGAVIHDFVSVLSKGHKYIDISLFPVKVQGENAENQIINAINLINKNYKFDVIVIARGGGSSTDLSCFDTEGVARSVFASKIPIISAVGHQIDYTLCDFSASVRAGTPSIAGEIIANNNQKMIDKFYNLCDNLMYNIEKLYKYKISSLYSMVNKISLLSSKAISRKESDINLLFNNMYNKIDKKILSYSANVRNYYNDLIHKTDSTYDKRQSDFQKLCALMDANNPLKLLSKGYTKVYKNGQAVTYDNININDNIEVLFNKGKINTQVISKDDINL